MEARWETDAARLATIRRKVFIEEQGVSEALEWDGLDADAVHVLALAGDTPVGCGRLLASGKIGRMAVLPAWREKGIGSALLDRLLDLCRAQGLVRVSLAAQVTAIPFYQRAGFAVCSPEFDDAGIPHRKMQLALSP
ncbi:MAG: GNAT family N-acetyltransferase [Methylobacterium sp.]|nr:GNAT family N-acetyltransferase [Methylobacterium sp.]